MSQIHHSFRYAMRGLRYAFLHEKNFRIQLALGACCIAAGVIFGLRPFEWIVAVFLIVSILILELLNTAMEKLIDIIRPRLDLHAESAKDIMAATVFVASLGAICIGALLFWPHIIEWLSPLWYTMPDR